MEKCSNCHGRMTHPALYTYTCVLCGFSYEIDPVFGMVKILDSGGIEE